MVNELRESLTDLVQRGGVVMWPLLAICFVAVMLAVERVWFWARNNHPRRLARARELGRLMRRGELDAARSLAAQDRGVYSRAAMVFLEETPSEAALIEAVERQRPRIERFMATLSTIITAAPMLGILGTVIGIIRSFNVLAEQGPQRDLSRVGRGIAEALLTTATGLAIAIVVLLIHNALRTRADRALGRIESLGAASLRGRDGRAANPPASDQA